MSNSSHTLKNSYIVPAFFERLVDVSYDRNFQGKIYLYFFIPGKLPHIKPVRLTIKDMANKIKPPPSGFHWVSLINCTIVLYTSTPDSGIPIILHGPSVRFLECDGDLKI